MQARRGMERPDMLDQAHAAGHHGASWIDAVLVPVAIAVVAWVYNEGLHLLTGATVVLTLVAAAYRVAINRREWKRGDQSGMRRRKTDLEII